MTSLAAMGFVALSFHAVTARAEPIEDRVRLGLEAIPLAVTSQTLGLRVDADLDGEDDDIEVDQLTLGLAPGFGINVGYGLSEHVILGARVQLSSTATERTGFSDDGFGAIEDVQRTVTTTVLALPYVMYVGGSPASSIRFAMSAMLGAESVRTKTEAFDQTISGYALGASIGFLAFPAERFSIDPSVFVLYERGSATQEDTGGESLDYASTTIGVLVTFSGWLGGGGHEPPTMKVDVDAPWGGRLPPRPRPALAAPVPVAENRSKVITTRTTLDSAVFMLLGAPERSDSPTALLLQRYAPAGEAACPTLEVEVDGAVAATVPITQKNRDNSGIDQITVQGAIDLALAERMAKGPTKLRWCGNERTLSLEARDGISRFIVTMRARIAAKPPAPAPAPPQPAPPQPAPTEAAPAPAVEPPAPPAESTPPATPAPAAPSPY